jgi:hypothetical protein
LTLAGTGDLGPATVDAIGPIALSLGRHAGYRGVKLSPPVARVEAAETSVLVVGTPRDNPLIDQLVDTQGLLPSQGLIEILPHPTQSTAAVLVVTGFDGPGLMKAAHALASAEVQELLSGSRVLIEQSQATDIPARDELPRGVPSTMSFTLADLGVADQTVRGTYSSPVSVPLEFEGDTKVRPRGASLRLDYAYGAQLDPDRSTLEILLNGVSIRSVALDRDGGDPEARLSVDLHAELLHPASEVTAVFHLVPDKEGQCPENRNRQLWATVFETSRFQVDRSHTSELPDLALLRHALWPYGPALDREGVALLLPDVPDWGAASAAFQTAAELGRVSRGSAPDLLLVPGGPGVLGRVKGRQLMVLSDGTAHDPLRVVALTGVIKAQGGATRRLTGASGATLVDASMDPVASTMEQVIYQAEPVRTALLLQSTGSAALLALADSLGDPTTLIRLDGSAAFLESNGDIATHALATRVVVGQPSILGRLQLLLSSTGLPLAVVLALVGTLATVLITRWAGGRHGQV